MIALSLISLLLLQGIPNNAGQSGTVTGTLKGADGKPLAYVRVAAVAPPETINDRTSAAMSGIAETDEQGRYSIEGLPQGRYYIAAGRVDAPTYYPGTLETKSAVIVSVIPGAVVSGMDFAMRDSSTRPAGASSLPASVRIPIRVRMEGGGKIPGFSDGKFALLSFTSRTGTNSAAVSLSASFVEVQGSAEYDVRVDDLAPGYVVQSLTGGSTDLRAARLTVPPAYAATISLVLRASPPAPSPATGVRVSGRVPNNLVRSVYLAGVPGTLYTDGTFEFRGVPPGRHALAGLDTLSPLGAIVVVGDRDVTGVELHDEVSPLPFGMRTPREPDPVGTATPGSVIPLASVRGVVMDEMTQKPVADGDLKITGYSKSETFIIDADGRFEIPRLFPGTYTVDVSSFGHATITQSLTVGPENIILNLTTRRLY